MAMRICSYCGTPYGDGPGDIFEAGPHPYERCLEFLEGQQDRLLDQLARVRRDVRTVRQHMAARDAEEARRRATCTN